MQDRLGVNMRLCGHYVHHACFATLRRLAPWDASDRTLAAATHLASTAWEHIVATGLYQPTHSAPAWTPVPATPREPAAKSVKTSKSSKSPKSHLSTATAALMPSTPARRFAVTAVLHACPAGQLGGRAGSAGGLVTPPTKGRGGAAAGGRRDLRELQATPIDQWTGCVSDGPTRVRVHRLGH